MLCSGYETSIQPVDPFKAGVVLINNCHNFTSGGLVNFKKKFVGNAERNIER